MTKRNSVIDYCADPRTCGFADALLDAAQVIIVQLDESGQIVRFNNYMEELCGYSLNEVAGKAWVSTFSPGSTPPSVDQPPAVPNDVLCKGNITPIVTKSGSERLIEWHAASSIRGGDDLLAIGADVTDREQAIRDAALQAQTRTVINQLWELVISGTEFDTLVRLAAAATAQVFSSQAAMLRVVQAGNTAVLAEATVGPGDGPQGENSLATANAGFGVSVTVGTWFDGKLHITLLLAQPQQQSEAIVDFVQKVANIIEVGLERRDFEARMTTLQHELLRVSRVSAVGELGTTIAHELNQPITAVVNYAQAAKRMLATSTVDVPQAVTAIMGKTVDEALRSGLVLRRLRNFLETGELEKVSANLVEIVRDACELSLSSVDAHYVTTKYDFTPPAAMVLVDKIQIQQAVFNLVRNALQAMSDTNDRQLKIATSHPKAGWIEVAVSDNGPGVDPSIMDRDRHSYTTTKSGNIGIGLSIVKKIITAHGGALRTSKTPGGGATFTFTVPLSDGVTS